MDCQTAQNWLDAYLMAWRSNDRGTIASLFSSNVTYRYHPWDDPVTGIDQLVESWLESPDDPESWEAAYTPYVVEGDRVVATGYSRYLATGDVPERLYHNCFLIEFDPDGRCRSFTEFFMRVD